MASVTKSVRRARVVATSLGLCVVLSSWAFGQGFSADAVKAAFLHRFASYVEWPPEALGDGPFVIGIADGDEVATHLTELLPQMTLQGRRAEVRRVARGTDLEGVHILYVGGNTRNRASELRAAATNRSILLVTDATNGLAGGGVINFLESENRVRFEVSLRAADRARLRVDSALLAVAARVEPPP